MTIGANFSPRRRKIITMGLGIMTLAPLSRFLFAEQKQANQQHYPWLDVFASEAKSAKIIGEAYLRHESGERNYKKLVRLISNDLQRTHPYMSDDHGMTMAVIRKKFSEEFEAGNTVCIRGWILSRTEARLCALQVLS